MPTFQQIISKLSNYWAEQGCLIQQGHDLEVGAGTFNPATFLRSLGPEPFNTVYVEPSRRPQDGRFGENPNRLQLFHQLQVIMKPSPFDIQQKYVESLEALGFDLKNHDIRFVHDDWESPTLGAWGLGWEVWLDGMEVTQFTYFQSVAGFSLKPISVELTYGLERLCMVLQKKDNFFDMQWNDTLTYGDVMHRNEVEWSHYNFHRASTEMWLRHFNDFEREAKTLVDLKLPIPAYDFVMKASHAFNMLEARGVLSVTERGGYIARVRDLAKLAATSFLESRETLGYPLDKSSEQSETPQTPIEFSPPKDPSAQDDFLFEIGSEELPAILIPQGCRILRDSLRKLLEKSGLSHGDIEIYATPRRLSALVKSLSFGTQASEELRRGPPLSICSDAAGNLTKQGIGFFQSLGLEPPSSLDAIKQGNVQGISIQQIKGNDYLVASISKESVSTSEILYQALPKLIADFNFPKKMRWGAGDLSYARPLHWIVAMHGETIIPFGIGHLLAGNTSFGHRQLNPTSFTIPHPSKYLELLKNHSVLADIKERRESILSQLAAIEKETKTSAIDTEKVLSQVLHLSEWPQLALGSFDTNFLKAPKEILTSEMIEHQKYFPLASSDGMLSNHFVITADNNPNDTIISGNQNVLSARLSDGVFLYEQDLQTSLDEFGEKLKTIVFQKDLGSLDEKTQRLKHLAIHLVQMLKISTEEKAKRAAALAKADLASELVQEFPDLQGIIGHHYALHQNEDAEVALAIEEHWMPKSEHGMLPSSETGIILSLADKLHNLIGYFSVGLKPTSSSDPFALRRQTIGLIKILIENSLSLDLKALFQASYSLFPSVANKDVLTNELLNYITSRAKGVLEDYDFKKDEIQAALRGVCLDPFDQFLRTKALHEFRQNPEFGGLYEVYKRAKGQLDQQKSHSFDPKLLKEEAEHALFQTLSEIKAGFKSAIETRDYEAAFSHLAKLQKPLSKLFNEVHILAEELDIRHNRLALLQEVFAHYELLLDFASIQIL